MFLFTIYSIFLASAVSNTSIALILSFEFATFTASLKASDKSTSVKSARNVFSHDGARFEVIDSERSGFQEDMTRGNGNGLS